MIIRPIDAAPHAELAHALARFEEQFRYPLGPGRFFRIEHGQDYPRFFRAMGEGICFVAQRETHVLGVLGAALRPVVSPLGDLQTALYLGDLKIDPPARGGRVLPRLADAARHWLGTRASAAFAVVMDGTPIVPTRYTGRLGIPRFVELGKIVVLRVPTALADRSTDWTATETDGACCYLRLSAGRYACPGGNPAERSEMSPLWLMDPEGGACGRLEDTRRAKRLIADDGVEMQSAHLSCFAYDDVDAGVALIRVALHHAAERGMPALFVAVPSGEAPAFARLDAVLAPATIYGTGLDPGLPWNINTAEI